MNFVFLAGLFLHFHNTDAMVPSQSSPGTTPGIQEIVKGRCYDYHNKKHLKVQSLTYCNDIWQLFHDAFAYKDLCTLKFKDYQPFFDKVGMEQITKSLFYTGTKKWAWPYANSGARYITSGDIFAGYLVDGLTWCGSKDGQDGIDYISCPMESNACDTKVFWQLLSKIFAEHAQGVVRVMLSGTRKKHGKLAAYDQQSIFAKFELPNLQKATKIIILLVHPIIKAPGNEEYCGKGSLKQLEFDAKQKHNIKAEITCDDDPDDVRHILCVDDHLKSDECVFKMGIMRPPTQQKQSWRQPVNN